MKLRRFARRSIVALALALVTPAFAQKNVIQPGDPIIASSASSPPTEAVANAIDGADTKYLNFDLATDTVPTPLKPVGFIVSPSVGVTRVTGMRIRSANDAPERDPKIVILEGSNDATVTGWTVGNWTPIVTNDVPAFTARFQTQSFSFANLLPFRHYRWTVTETTTPNNCCMQVAEVELLGATLPADVTQPGDPIIASSASSPPTEAVSNAIDNADTKYLNFDLATDTVPVPLKPVGFIVSPQVGRTVVSGMTIRSANDGPERDPKTVTLEGSNDATISGFNSGAWEAIQTFDVPIFATRFQTQTFLFDNVKPYRHYRWTVTETATPNNCCMQVAEVELLGTGGPKDVTQPGDPIIASSASSPPTEAVSNAIDNADTKYLNFDLATDTVPVPLKPVGFVVTPSVGETVVTGMTIRSANDAPERDPKIVILEGSNDATITGFNSGNWTQITTLDVPAFATRFETKEFFFANSTAYKHYRWTVTETATANNCCMQVAEVELLAVTSGADCSKARFVKQPINQPVLLGESATFLTTVNGPWPIQWLKNGQPIPGATGGTYTTDPVTATSTTNIYAVQIVGCEISQNVQAQIFTPSATKSIAVNFVGGQANAAPSTLTTNDILGVHLQAYWNDAGLLPDGTTQNDMPNTGTLPDETADPARPFLDSDGNATTVTFSWDTGGDWGSGTGENTPLESMLNGLAGSSGPGTQNTFTFDSVPEGTHSLIVYSVAPPTHVVTLSYTVGDKTTYMRVQNSDEYKTSPGFFRSTSTAQAGAALGNYVRFDNIVVPAGGGSVALVVETLTSGFERATGVNGLQLLLNTGVVSGETPAITVEPQPVVAEAGATARLSVTATGPGLTYQWRRNGQNLANGGNISGATSGELVISNFSAADVGVYSVAILNPNGSVISKNATANLSTYNINDQLVSYWKLDETTGATAANSVAGGSAGTVTNTLTGTAAATWGAGQVNGALVLDGSSYVFVPDYTKATKAIAGAAWVNIDPATAGDVAIFRNAQGDMITSGGAARVVGQFELGLTYDANTLELRPVATVGIGANLARVNGTAAVPTGSWHHIAFTADGAQIRLYVDGQLVGVTDYLADINPPDVPWISMGMQLNRVDPNDPTSDLGPDPANAKAMTGSLDDVALWTRALTAQEVDLVYDAGVAHAAVTTVIVPKPAGAPTLSVTRTATTITLTFTGKLQSTTALTPGAVWSDVSTTSPVTEQTSTGIKFYRAAPAP